MKECVLTQWGDLAPCLKGQRSRSASEEQLREFFKSFEAFNFKDLSATQIQKLVDAHGLSVSSLLTQSTKKLRDIK